MKVNIFPHLQNSDEQYVLVDRGGQPHLRRVVTAGLEGQQQVSRLVVLLVLVVVVLVLLVLVVLYVFGLVVGRGLRLVSCRRPPNSAQWKSRIQLWSCSNPFTTSMHGLDGIC